MDVDQLALLAGILFILIALVGGGFRLKELTIPRVPTWSRLVALALGILFVAPFFLNRYAPSPAPPETSPAVSGGLVYLDDTPDRTAHGLQLERLEVWAEHRPPRVDDRIQVSFVLRNVAEDAMALQETFVAARSPAEENRDFGHGHAGLVVDVNASVTVKANLIVDAPGRWQFWPCYILRGGAETDYCPSRWRAFPVMVED